MIKSTFKEKCHMHAVHIYVSLSCYILKLHVSPYNLQESRVFYQTDQNT